MEYNFHNEKYQQKDIGGIRKEQFREYSDEGKYKNYVDHDRTELNEYIELSENGSDWNGRIKNAKERMEEITGKSLRKDAVVLCSTVESVPQSWGNDICSEYFKEKAGWYEKYLQEKAGVDEGSMLSVCIHLDETTPHATYTWMPLKDEKFQAKNIVDRKFLKSLQTDSQEYTLHWVDEWNEEHPVRQIERIDPASKSVKREHLDELDYKTMKSEEKLQKLEEKHSEMSDIIKASEELLTEKNEKLEHIQSMTADAEESLASTRSQLEEQVRIHRETEIKTREAEKRYEDIVKEITKAPDLVSYEDVRSENENLKAELSFKDKVIERLQKSVDHWKSQAEEWKNKFTEVMHLTTEKIKEFFGVEDDSERRDENAGSMSDRALYPYEDAAMEIDSSFHSINPAKYEAGEDIYPGYNYDQILKNLKNGDYNELFHFLGSDEKDRLMEGLSEQTRMRLDEMSELKEDDLENIKQIENKNLKI